MDFSFIELLLVGLIAFLVLGPEELVLRSRQFGRFIGRAKSYGNNLRVLAEEEYLSGKENDKEKPVEP